MACGVGRGRVSPLSQCGKVAEWLKAHAWKVCNGESRSRVRIPLCPPINEGPLRALIYWRIGIGERSLVRRQGRQALAGASTASDPSVSEDDEYALTHIRSNPSLSANYSRRCSLFVVSGGLHGREQERERLRTRL